jgi:hypothetical protein
MGKVRLIAKYGVSTVAWIIAISIVLIFISFAIKLTPIRILLFVLAIFLNFVYTFLFQGPGAKNSKWRWHNSFASRWESSFDKGVF